MSSTQQNIKFPHQTPFIEHWKSSFPGLLKQNILFFMTVFASLFLSFMNLPNHEMLLKKHKSFIGNKNDYRFLNNFSEEITESYYFDKQIYEFINNLTTLNYFGSWKNLYFKENIFESSAGNVEIEFMKRKKNFFNTKLFQNATHLGIIFLLKDGKFIDNYIKGNISFPLGNSFISQLNNVNNRKKKSIVLVSPNTTIFFFACTFLTECTTHHYTHTNITLEFVNKEKELIDKFLGRFVSVFSEINISFRERNEKFTLDLQANVLLNKKFMSDVRNYSFMVSTVALIEMYFVIKNLINLKNNVKKCQGVDILTVCTSVIIKALICTLHFYLSITAKDDEIAFYYAVPAIIYFSALSFFEIKTAFYVFKARYISLFETDMEMFRTRLYQYAFVFYLTLFVSLLLCRLLMMNFATLYFLFVATWGFQILHSAKVGLKPPMNLSYFFCVSLSKFFFPIYLRGYPENIFEFKPCPGKVCAIFFTVFIEICIISLQKYYGAKIILPSFIKKVYYNYYYDECIIRDNFNHNSNCEICSGSLDIETILDYSDDLCEKGLFQTSKRKLIFFEDSIRKMNNCIKNIILHLKKKKFMITPCNHVFHSECLENWLEGQNYCPLCKQQLPNFE